MTASHGLSSVNCTSCGAGLSVLGGGRVKSHVCGYCGAVLDTQDNYKVLASIGKRNHPASPVQIGQTLTVDGIEFTVIGTLGVTEQYGGRSWRWVEHQVFSPTHGYLWLNFDEGNLTLSRKVRDFNMGHWLTPATVERSETPPVRMHNGQRYRYYDSGVTQIDFMEGEFNWIPKLGEKKQVINLLGDDGMLSLVRSSSEREVELTRLLPREETAADLGIEVASLGVANRHPLQPYVPLIREKFLRRMLFWTAVVAFLIGGFFSLFDGRPVLEAPEVRLADLPESYTFEITNTSQLANVVFRTNFQNQWAVFTAEIIGPDGEVDLAGARSVSFYSGRDSDGSWTEGSRNSSFRFRPDAEGSYTVRLEYAEGLDQARGTVSLMVAQGKPAGLWLNLLALACIVGWFYLRARKMIHTSRRFAGSDWHEE